MSWSGESHKRVAALLTRLVEAGFGAIDPFGDAIFGIVARPRRGFGHHGAYAEAPAGPTAGCTVAAA